VVPLLHAQIEDGDLETIAAPLDFFGHQLLFFPARAASLSLENQLRFANMTPEEAVAGYQMTAMDWPIVPQGWFGGSVGACAARLRFFPGDPPSRKTVAAFDDEVVDGQIHDERRLAYLREHFAAAHQTIEQARAARILCGRSWTTSNGPTATISASDVHVDYKRAAARRKQRNGTNR